MLSYLNLNAVLSSITNQTFLGLWNLLLPRLLSPWDHDVNAAPWGSSARKRLKLIFWSIHPRSHPGWPSFLSKERGCGHRRRKGARKAGNVCQCACVRACIPLFFPHFSKESPRSVVGEFDGALILFNLDYRVADSKNRSYIPHPPLPRSWTSINSSPCRNLPIHL